MLNPGGAGRDFLFVQSTTEIGGAETVLLNLFEASEALRRRAVVATLGFGTGDLPARLRAVGAEVAEFKMARLRYPWKLVPTFAALRAFARRSGVRAVIGNGAHPQLVAGPLARLAGARSVFIVHGLYPHPLLANEPRVVLAFAGPCDRLLTVSKAVQAAAQRLRPGVPTRLVYNGTPLREVAPADARAARAELGAGDQDVLVGMFGRFQRSKGQDVFLAAARDIGAVRPRARFALVGDSFFGLEPEYANELRRDAAVSDLGDRLVFTGFRKDVPRLMAACDIVCNPSREPESFGMAIVEAMAQGRAVIASEGGGPNEIIAAPDQGILVPPGDREALARALLALIDDGDRRRALGANARERVRSQFSVDVMASTLVRHLDEVIAGR